MTLSRTVTFLGETRSLDEPSYDVNSVNVPVIGTFVTKDISGIDDNYFYEPATVSFEIEVPKDMTLGKLALGSQPGNPYFPGFQKARWVAIELVDGTFRHFIYDNAKATLISGETNKMLCYAVDPRIWFENKPGFSSYSQFGSLYVSDEEDEDFGKLRGTKGQLLVALMAPVSTNSANTALEYWKEQPAFTVDPERDPTAFEQLFGAVRPDTLPNWNDTITIAPPGLERPIKEALDELLTNWGEDIAVYPVDITGEDGTNAPMWRWCVIKPLPVIKSLPDYQVIKGDALDINMRYTDILYYAQDGSDYHYNGGSKEPASTYLRKAWLGIDEESYDVARKTKTKISTIIADPQPTPISFGDSGGVPDVYTPEVPELPVWDNFDVNWEERDFAFVVNPDSNTSYQLPFTLSETSVSGNFLYDVWVNGIKQFTDLSQGNSSTTGPTISVVPFTDNIVVVKPGSSIISEPYPMGWLAKLKTQNPGSDKSQLKAVLACGIEAYRTRSGDLKSMQDFMSRETALEFFAEPERNFDVAETGSTIPANFWSGAFNRCARLRQLNVWPYRFDDATDIPANFMYTCFTRCYRLEKVGFFEDILGNTFQSQFSNIENIGSNFLYEALIYVGSDSPVGFSTQIRMPKFESATWVNDAFMYQTFLFAVFNRNLESPVITDYFREMLPNVTSIGRNFLYRTFYDLTPKNAVLNVDNGIFTSCYVDLPSLVVVGDNFMQETWYSDYFYVLNDDEPEWPVLEAVGDNFLASSFGKNVFSVVPEESELPSLLSFGENFRSGQYMMAQSGLNPFRMNISGLTVEKFPPLIDIPGYYSGQLPGGYRASSMRRRIDYVSAVSPVGAGVMVLETVSRDDSTSWATTYRGGQWEGNGLDGFVSGMTNRAIKYSDGVDVIEGVSGIPFNFYG